MNIKAVVFDYGQVITLPQDPQTIDLLAQRIGVQRSRFEPLLWSLRDEFDRGTVSAREYYKDILRQLEVNMEESAIDELAAIDFDSWKNLDSGTISLMEDLKKSGYTLGILSNMPYEFRKWALENFNFFTLTDVNLFSCDVKLIKPEAAVYQKLLEMLKLDGKEVAFFDDKLENIVGAQALGIEGFVWEGAEIARRTLSDLGVKL